MAAEKRDVRARLLHRARESADVADKALECPVTASSAARNYLFFDGHVARGTPEDL
jgi:prepilin-type processing-associated H-X9-DG protein